MTARQIGLTTCFLLAAAGIAYSADILPQIPADAPLVVIVRHPKNFADRTNQLIARIKPGAPTRSFQSFIDVIQLPAGSIDETAPIALICPPGGIAGSRPVLVFRPTSLDSWAVADPEQPIAVAKLGGAFFGRRDDWVFAGESPRPVLRAIRSGARRSLATGLDAQERALFDESDTLLRLRVDAWRNEINQALAFVRFFGNAGAMGSDDLQSQAQAAAIGWFTDGAARIASDMSVLDLGLKMDDEGVRFVHYHAFKPKSSVADYLRSVHRGGGDIWRGIEKRPFLVAFAWDAKAKQDSGIMQDLMARMMKMPAMGGAATQPAMAQLVADCEAFYHREQAAATLVDLSPEGTLGIFGTKRFDEPEEGVRLLKQISEGGSQVMDAFAPSWASGGEFKEVRRGDITALEMSFSTCKIDDKNRALIEAIYGKNALYQIAAFNKDTLGYAISSDPNAIARLGQSVAGDAPTLDTLPGVADISKRLPAEPCMLAIVDVERATRFLPEFAKADESIEVGTKGMSIKSGHTGKHALVRTRAPFELPAGTGPLIGWAMTTGPTWVRGEAYMSQDDIVKSIPLVKRMAQDFKTTDAKPGATKSRAKVRVIERKDD